MARIAREGRVQFGDASLSVWEEGISAARAADGYKAETEWEHRFKKEVFLRIIQMLNRLGWTCTVPKEYIKQYGLDFARSLRECSKGDLRGWLDISGRAINFEMWQGVNTPTRPDHGGRYESNKEAIAPYLLRLEMYRTRNRIRDYLCNVFSGYHFDPKHYSIYHKKLQHTAMEQIQQRYADSRHFKGDWPAYLAKERWMDGNRKSADGALLDHGQRVWLADRKGRIVTGIAYYNINNMWWVQLGKYDYTNEAGSRLYTNPPENLRAKRNKDLRRQRLAEELAKAVHAMNYERAAKLRDITYPKDEPIFTVWHKDHQAYHCTNFRGYTNDITLAGRFTRTELRGYDNEQNEIRPAKAAQPTPQATQAVA